MHLLACPTCHRQLSVAPELLGQLLECPHCGNDFSTAPVAIPVNPPQPQAPSDPLDFLEDAPLNVVLSVRQFHADGSDGKAEASINEASL
jgi:hypothetical protein